MNTYQRQLLHQLINELTANLSPNLHAAQMIAAELKGAMQAQAEIDDIHPITDADGWVENTGVDPKCMIASWKCKNGYTPTDYSPVDSRSLSWGISDPNDGYTITHYKPS